MLSFFSKIASIHAIAIASADLVVFYECACVWTAMADEIVLGGAMYAGVINRPDDV
jgi:hypothetical protein